MMTASVVTSAEYYCGGGAEAPNAESYYLDAETHGEPPGRWSGTGAERLELSGDIQDDDLRVVLGKLLDPRTGEPIGTRLMRRRPIEEKIAERIAAEPDALPERIAQIRSEVERGHRPPALGYDFTFGLVKSITVVHTAAWRAELAAIRSGDQTRADRARAIRSAVEDAIHEGNSAALRYLTEHARARRSSGTGSPTEWVKSPDLIVASFFQHTNRNIDPHLHEHNVIVNRAWCEDGEVRALDFADLKEHRAAAGSIADRVAEEHLAALGFQVELRADGVSRELVIAPAEVCDQFSSRAKEIEARLKPVVAELEAARARELTAHELWHVRKDITLRTRRGKSAAAPESPAERLARLDAEIIRLGQSLDGTFDATLSHLESRAGRSPAAPWSVSAVIAVAVDAVSRARSTWRRPDLIKELHLALPTLGVTGEDAVRVLERLADAALSSDLVVQVAGLDPAAEDQFVQPASRKWAGAGTVAAEEALRKAAVVRSGHHLDRGEVTAWLRKNAPTIVASKPGTVTDQQAAVEGIASSDALVCMLVGPAGTGKSFAAGALAGAWEDLSDGGRVIGLAVSENAARVLRDDGITRAANTARWLDALARLDAGRATEGDQDWAIGPKDLVWVDEASMGSTQTMEEITRVVQAAGARMVLAGDPRQLGAVQSGGVMGLLDGQAETYALSCVRRFRETWERGASLRLRDGDIDVLADYDRHGRITGHSSLDAAVKAATAAAVVDRLDGRDTTVITETNELAAEIARAVRARLVAAGLVEDGPTILCGRDGNEASIGDRVAARRNDYRLGVTNRDQYEITAIDGDRVTIRANDGTIRHLPATYVGEDLQLAYAGTVHATQGMTLDTGHLVTDGTRLDPKALYVAATRGKIRNTLHVACEPADAEESPETIEVPKTLIRGDRSRETPTAVLASVLERQDTDRAALVEADTDTARIAAAGTVLGRIESVTRSACRERLDRHLDELVTDGTLAVEDRARLAADQATEHLSRVLRAVEQAGSDPKETLAGAIRSRSLGTAGSVAQVLSCRIRSGDDVPVPRPDLATTAPADISPEHARALEGLHARAATRVAALGRDLVEDTPGWAMLLLGPAPASDSPHRAQWEHRAGTVAAWREATGWDHPTDPIGRAPGLSSTERRAQFSAAWEAAGRPPADLTEAMMSDGRLLARARAAERARREAPANVDPALRAAELAAEQARADAVTAQTLADTAEQAGDPELAAQHRADAARHRATAEVHAAAVTELTRQADARDGWHATMLPTMAAGDRATREMERRGTAPGHEPDRVTAEDWLATEHHARAAEDPHRTVTDRDVHEHEDAPLTVEEADALPEVQIPDEPTGINWARRTLGPDLSAAELELNAALASRAHRANADRASQDEHVPAPEHTVRWTEPAATTLDDQTAAVDSE